MTDYPLFDGPADPEPEPEPEPEANGNGNGRPKRPRQRKRPAEPEPTGADLAAAGADRAADHADRAAAASGQEKWSDAAYRALCTYGAAADGEFMTEDARKWAHATAGLPLPPDGRAWGAVINRARAAGRLVWQRYERLKSPNCHACPGAVWRWHG